MKKTWSMCAAVLLVSALGARPAAAREASTLLVIPSRYTVIQFAFDVARIRSVYLLAYDRPAKSSENLLYAWDNAKALWVEVQEADVRSGALFDEKPGRTVLVGDDQTLPADLADAVAPYGKATRVTSLNLMDVANGLNQAMNFNGREWKWFAGRYGLQLKETNYEERRWGRYGPPGTKTAKPQGAATAASAEMEPTEVEELPVLTPVQAAPTTVPMPNAPAAPAQQSMVIPAAPAAAPAVTPPAAPTEAAIDEGAAPAAAAAPAPADIPPENK